MVLLILVCCLEGNHNRIRFDFREVEEVLIDFLVGIDVWTTKIIGLTFGLLCLDAVVDSQADIIGENRLHLGVQSLNDELHSVEHLQLHAPLGG